MKRPAATQLVGEDRFGAGPPDSGNAGNPFAGISLLGSSTSCSSFFTAAAASTSGFSLGGGSATTSFAPSAPASAEASNPFMGLSLFSPPASAGGMFTSAANSLQTSTALGSSGGIGSHSFVGEASQASAEAPIEDGEEDEDGEQEEEDSEVAASGDATGEEDEEVVFRTESKLWKLVRRGLSSEGGEGEAVASGSSPSAGGEDGGWRWQERGCGIVHINRNRTRGTARLVMRMRGILKLLLNTPVFPTTKYEKVGQKSVRFVGVDAEDAAATPKEEGKVSLCAFRLSMQNNDQQGKFLSIMREVMGSPAV